MYLHGDDVGARMYPARHIEPVHGIGASDVCVIGNQVSIYPQVGARNDAVGAQQRMPSCRVLRQRELGAIPPGRHEEIAAGIGHLRRTQVVAVEHVVLERAVFQQAGHDRRSAAHWIPLCGGVAGRGDLGAALLRFRAVLNLPMRDGGGGAGVDGYLSGCVGRLGVCGRCRHGDHHPKRVLGVSLHSVTLSQDRFRVRQQARTARTD